MEGAEPSDLVVVFHQPFFLRHHLQKEFLFGLTKAGVGFLCIGLAYRKSECPRVISSVACWKLPQL